MIDKPNISELYARHIKPLPVGDRLALLAVMAQDLANPEAAERSLLELEGLGADLWQGVNAQSHVDNLRAEWDYRPGQA